MAFTLARAVLVLRNNDPTAAAIVSGVIGGGALARQFAVLSWEREPFEHALDEIRAELGDESYQAAVVYGSALTFDDAVETTLDAMRPGLTADDAAGLLNPPST